MRISAFICLPSTARVSWSAMVKPRLGMKGKGWAGSIASGVSLGDLLALEQHDADAGKRAAQIGPDRLLVGGKLRDGLVDQDELL
jgi:hypothetical protein